MKLTVKTLSMFFSVLFLCLFIGTMFWELFARMLSPTGFGADLSIGPYGFDLGVISFWIRANPGTLLGLPCAVLLFRTL